MQPTVDVAEYHSDCEQLRACFGYAVEEREMCLPIWTRRLGRQIVQIRLRLFI